MNALHHNRSIDHRTHRNTHRHTYHGGIKKTKKRKSKSKKRKSKLKTRK